MPIIEAEKVTFVYNPGTPFEKKAVDDVSFSIEEGEFIGLIGHTGSGKSTLIQHLNALIFPTAGEIYIDGKKIEKDGDLMKLRQKVGMVFQYPEHQLFEDTCGADVSYGPKNLGLSPEEIEERVRDAIESVGLDYDWVKDRSPFELSGGQKRRVAIAGVLAMHPKVLILDEPTAGLDPAGRDEIIQEILEIKQKRNLTVVYVTHSMEDIAGISDRIMVMEKGKLAYFEEPEVIFSKEKELEAMGLDVPAVVEFTNFLREMGVDLPTFLTPEEAAEYIGRLLP